MGEGEGGNGMGKAIQLHFNFKYEQFLFQWHCYRNTIFSAALFWTSGVLECGEVPKIVISWIPRDLSIPS